MSLNFMLYQLKSNIHYKYLHMETFSNLRNLIVALCHIDRFLLEILSFIFHPTVVSRAFSFFFPRIFVTNTFTRRLIQISKISQQHCATLINFYQRFHLSFYGGQQSIFIVFPSFSLFTFFSSMLFIIHTIYVCRLGSYPLDNITNVLPLVYCDYYFFYLFL